jgi:glycosyltransferase involved in cell wall biosynthesis
VTLRPQPPQPRVLLTCEWFVKYTAGLARGLAEAGCDVKLLSRDHDLEFGNEPGAMREFVREAAGPAVEHLELGGRVREVRHLGTMLSLRRRLATWGPDVVHVQDSLTHDLRLAVASGIPGRRYALTVHDPVPHPGDAQPSSLARVRRRRLRRGADLLFVHSAGMAEELRQLGDARGAVEVVPHGFAAVEPAPLPERPAILFFGRISRYKGLDTLLEAMPLVWERRPEVTLTVAGDGPLPEVASLADDRVELRHEHVPEAAVAGLFAAATCVALPYRQASQSGVGAESKKFGRAIVATEVGGLPELVGPDCGRLVPPGDPPALAAALLEVIETPGLAERLGRGAAASAAESDWDAVARMTLSAYRRWLL